jgi:hypothetical protein
MDPFLEIIPGDTDNKPSNLIREAGLSENIAMVRQEFVGQPEICHELVKHIMHIRRGIDVDHNTNCFYDLWEKYSHILIKEYNSRWLISVVDTIIDTGDDLEAAVAMNISQCINRCGLDVALQVNSVDYRYDPDRVVAEIKVPTWDGLETPDIPSGDMMHNMMVRLDGVVASVPMLNEIWIEIKNRLRGITTVPMNFLASVNTTPEYRDFFKQ